MKRTTFRVTVEAFDPDSQPLAIVVWSSQQETLPLDALHISDETRGFAREVSGLAMKCLLTRVEREHDDEIQDNARAEVS